MDQYNLFYYPPGGGVEGREARGAFPDVPPAREATPFPDQEDWKTDGTGALVTDEAVITADDREYEEWHIEYENVPDEPGGTVELRIVRGGELTVTVDGQAYADAKDHDTLSALLKDAVKDTPETVTVLGPNDEVWQLPAH